MPLGLATSISHGPSLCAPPTWFRGVEGVRAAWASSGGPYGRTPKRLSGSAAQRAGIRYERKALDFLAKTFGPNFIRQPWYQFEDNVHNIRWCQPDGLYVVADTALLFEIKVPFTSDAWWQLRKLYEPVVKAATKVNRVIPVLFCKNFDPAVPFPERCVHLANLSVLSSSAKEWDCTQMGVFVWKPRR